MHAESIQSQLLLNAIYPYSCIGVLSEGMPTRGTRADTTQSSRAEYGRSNWGRGMVRTRRWSNIVSMGMMGV